MKETITIWPDSLHHKINDRAEELLQEICRDVTNFLNTDQDIVWEEDQLLSILRVVPKALGEQYTYNINTYPIHHFACYNFDLDNPSRGMDEGQLLW